MNFSIKSSKNRIADCQSVEIEKNMRRKKKQRQRTRGRDTILDVNGPIVNIFDLQPEKNIN